MIYSKCSHLHMAFAYGTHNRSAVVSFPFFNLLVIEFVLSVEYGEHFLV